MFEIGSTLRQARERRNIGLDQVEAETKIRPRYLRALEEEDFDILPGPTFIRGFLRTYAAYLGLDGQLFVDEYNSRYFDPLRDEDVFHRRRLRNAERDRVRHRTRSNAILVAVVAIVAVAVLVIIAATYPSAPRTPSTPTAPPPQRTIANPLIIAGPSGGASSVTSATAARQVTLIVVANARTRVRITEGYGSPTARIVVGGLIDPASARVSTPLQISRRGFRVDISAQGAVKLIVDGEPRLIPTGRHFVVGLDGTVASIRGA
jgi:cytoskeleton protein RodZ